MRRGRIFFVTTPQSDFDLAVRALRTQTLPAVVAYTQQGSAHGIARWDQQPERIVVDVKNNRIISRTPASDDSDGTGEQPVTKRIFDPACYRAASERLERWNGLDVIAIAVVRTHACNNDDDFSTVYSDASTSELVGADSTETDEGMTVDITVRYARFGSYILPSSISAHAHGHGWLFWARERGEIRYSNFSFDDSRRQAE